MVKVRKGIPTDTFELHEGEYCCLFHHIDGRCKYGGWINDHLGLVTITNSLVIEDGKPHFTADLNSLQCLASTDVIRFTGCTENNSITLIPLRSRVQYLASLVEANELINRGVLCLTVTGTFTKEGFIRTTE